MSFDGIKKKSCGVDYRLFTDNPDKYASYILGLIRGDGNLYFKYSYRITIKCVESDLSEVLDIFNTTGKWTFYRQPSINNWQPILTLTTSNKILYQHLSSFNYLTKSGSNSLIQDALPENLQHYWWRGYLDADGCVYIHKKNRLYQVSFASTYEQDWTFCEQLFTKLGVNYQIKRRIFAKSKGSYIIASGRKNSKKILDYIYQGDIFGFSRKYQKYLEY